jgi:hypothetical protein
MKINKQEIMKAAITEEMKRRVCFYYGFFQCLEVVMDVAHAINCHLTTTEENALVDWMMFSTEC